MFFAHTMRNMHYPKCIFQLLFAFSHLITLTIVQSVNNFSTHINNDVMAIENNWQVRVHVGQKYWSHILIIAYTCI